jgi:hypothetical protein
MAGVATAQRIRRKLTLAKNVEETYCSRDRVCYIPPSVSRDSGADNASKLRQLFFVWLDNVFAFDLRLMTTGS